MILNLTPDLLEAYSRGEISRREIGERLNAEISFGDLFGALLDRGLPLPRSGGSGFARGATDQETRAAGAAWRMTIFVPN